MFTGNCEINLNRDLGQPTPIMVYANTTNIIRVSNGNGQFNFKKNEGIHLACTGTNNYLRVKDSHQDQEATVYCIGGKKFVLDNVTFNFGDFKCVKVCIYLLK